MITKRFYTKVAGVTFNNIQAYLPNVRINDTLQAIFEPNNPYDKNAIALYHQGTQIGYFPRHIAKALRPTDKLDIQVTAVTGGYDNLSYGCNIFVTVDDGIEYTNVSQSVIDEIFNL